MNFSLSVGVAVAVGLACLRILYEISIWWIIVPGYLLALVITLFVPGIFTSIAFDSGGSASGAMTATFLVPFAIGAARALEHDELKYAFGLVAFVALAPLLTIQILGLIYKLKGKKARRDKEEDEIIDLKEV
jgi:MFS superfamily sulfate permease-like transporter